MPKLTLEEKRKEILRRQLYGKEVYSPKSDKVTPVKPQAQVNTNRSFSIANYQTPTATSENISVSYLTSDLVKILIFSSLVIAFQIILHFAISNQLIRLPF